MSRIGKQPIALASDVSITVSPTGYVKAKGPRGTLAQQVDPAITVEASKEQVILTRPSDQTNHKALHGLYRALIQNMVTGVTQGYSKTLEFIGVGYKAIVQNNVLEMHIGYSHPIFFMLPPELNIKAGQDKKNKRPLVIIEGIDKQLVGQVCAKIKSLRKKDPYKGKGIYFVGEPRRKKIGKAAGK